MGKILDWVIKNGSVGIGSSGDVVGAIQQNLVMAGHVLVPDADYGSITEAAVSMFQAAHNLAVVGFVGTKTAAHLDNVIPTVPIQVEGASILKVAPWLSQMRAITGVKEFPGRASNPIIMAWRSDIARAFPETVKYVATYTGDEIAWCGFGLAGCCARAGVRPPFGKDDDEKFMYAKSWAHWGTQIEPRPGCIMVFSRAGGGHVSILERMDGQHAYIRGCNQSDMVNVAHKSMDTFVAAVWPSGWSHDVQIVSNISNAVKSTKEA